MGCQHHLTLQGVRDGRLLSFLSVDVHFKYSLNTTNNMSCEGQYITCCLVTVGVVTNELFCTCNMARWLSKHHCFSVPRLTGEISWTTKGDNAWRSRVQYQIALACSVTYKYHNPNISGVVVACFFFCFVFF